METILSIGILGSYGLVLVLDFVAPARDFPKIPWWRTKGLLFFVLFNVLGITLPLVWDELLAEHRLIDATALGTVGGAVVGLLAAQFLSYWWHRALHRSSFLWRWFHQIHHSAERIDVFGAHYLSPLDIVGFLFVGSLALVWVVGISAEAAIVTNAVSSVFPFFQHANIRTPRWLGYLVQRPENHAVHHQRGVHAFNYGDIALWDIVFGTFRNPETWNGVGGFYDGASRRLPEMLAGKDVAALGPSGARAVGTPERSVRGRSASWGDSAADSVRWV